MLQKIFMYIITLSIKLSGNTHAQLENMRAGVNQYTEAENSY